MPLLSVLAIFSFSASLEIVKAMGKVIKSCNYAIHPLMLKSFAALRLTDASLDQRQVFALGVHACSFSMSLCLNSV